MRNLKPMGYVSLMLLAIVLGSPVVNYFYPKKSAYASVVDWNQQLDTMLSKTGSISGSATAEVDGEPVPCHVTINKDRTGARFKDGRVMSVPFTMYIVGNAVTYHFSYQGKEWDYTSTMQELIKQAKGKVTLD
jgi:hypothetical protein